MGTRIDRAFAYQETLQNAAGATGNGTAFDLCNTATRDAYASAILSITGTFSATVTFEGTIDGSNWFSLLGQNMASGVQSATATGTGAFAFNVIGLTKIRARVSAYTSGNVTVKGSFSSLSLPLPSSVSVSASAVQVQDSTNTNTWAIDASGNGPVTVTGSNVVSDDFSGTVSGAPAALAAGASWNSGWLSNTDGRAVGLLIDCDTVVEITLELAATAAGGTSVGGEHHYKFNIDPGLQLSAAVIPPVRISAPYYRWTLKNPTSTDQATMSAYEQRQYGGIFHRQGVPVVLARSFAPRDTSVHTPFGGADMPYLFTANILLTGDGTHPIFVRNTTDQQVNITLYFVIGSNFGAPLGASFSVAAGAKVVKTNADYPGLDVSTTQLYAAVAAAVAPTTGEVDIAFTSLFGG